MMPKSEHQMRLAHTESEPNRGQDRARLALLLLQPYPRAQNTIREAPTAGERTLQKTAAQKLAPGLFRSPFWTLRSSVSTAPDFFREFPVTKSGNTF